MFYWLVFTGTFLEGPIATLVAAGLCANDPEIELFWVFIAAACGNFCADLSWYVLGRMGESTGIIERLAWLKKHQARIAMVKRQMRARYIWLLVTTKLGMGAGSIPVLIAAGMVPLAWQRLLLSLICCEIVWSGALILIGYHLTSYALAEKLFASTNLFFIAVLLFMGLAVYCAKHCRKKE